MPANSAKNPSKSVNTSISAGTKSRPPIVVVMGHVDHGKTTLLDYIRKTRVAEREAGGITQSVGAYEIERNGQKITFVDTPGHQAFTKMRERGAQIADLAILVVAADDGVKPQTEEAISILQNSNTPFVVAINKIDKNNADEERTKQNLLAHGVLLEKYGGSVSWCDISAKTGQGVDELLDLIILMWQMENLTYDPNSMAKGFILESKMDSQRGVVASVIVKDGTLKSGNYIATKTVCGKIKILENFLGKKVDQLIPSSPALIVGFDNIPSVGEEFLAGDLEIEARPETEPAIREKQELVEVDKRDVLKLIVKADVSGSLEALSQIILSMVFDTTKIKILDQGVGEVTDGDVKSAVNLGAVIVAFNTKIAKPAENLARAQSVEIISSNIIYRIVEAIEEKINNVGKKEEVGSLEVLAVFSQKNKKQVIGGKVFSGFLTLNQKVNIVRAEQPIGYGRITNLQQNKADMKKVEDGECGLMVESPTPIQVGDYLIVEKN